MAYERKERKERAERPLPTDPHARRIALERQWMHDTGKTRPYVREAVAKAANPTVNPPAVPPTPAPFALANEGRGVYPNKGADEFVVGRMEEVNKVKGADRGVPPPPHVQSDSVSTDGGASPNAKADTQVPAPSPAQPSGVLLEDVVYLDTDDDTLYFTNVYTDGRKDAV